MSVSIKKNRRLNQAGVSLLELLVVMGVAGLLIVSTLTVMLYFYGDVVRSNVQSQLAVESQNVLRAVVEDLRISSSIRENNTVSDDNAPGGTWTTSNDNLILIISTPALDNDNEFIVDTNTGYPYQNEIVYFAADGVLYKRFLANPDADGNKTKTSCPAAEASASCPADVIMSEHFETMNFIFYDQDDAVTTTLPNARSIKLIIDMQRRSFGKTLEFSNSIRITLRNSTG